MDRFIVERRFWPIPLLFLSLVVAVSYELNIRSLDRHVEELSVSQGRFIFKMIEAMRLWNARHGGVYVFVDEETQPNPYLDIPDRDLLTAEGRALTLVIPAYMTRQLSNVVLTEAQVGLRLTSLKPLNPRNRPDEWERAALHAFEAGSAEKTDILDLDGRRTARYIGALTTRQDCLRCHEKQGYRLGDVRGGISISYSVEPYLQAARPQRRHTAVIHLAAWLVFMFLTLYSLRRTRTHMLSLKQAEQEQHDLVIERTKDLQREVWERKQAELRLRRLVDASGDGIYAVAADGRCTLCNPTACSLLGLARAEDILGRNIHAFVSGGNEELLVRLNAYRAGQAMHADGDTFRRADGSAFPVEYRIAPILVDGKTMGAVATFQDITERKRSQAQIWLRANYDALTGLPNRSLFHDRLERAILQEARRHGQVAALFIDLDGFKQVNDLLGHDAGDALLREAARRIGECVRESDTAARLGGDEFVVALSEVADRGGALRVAEKIRARLALPYHLSGRIAHVSCSIGVALYPEHAETVIALLQRADNAMYRAKHRGKNAIVFHGDEAPAPGTPDNGDA